MAIIKSISRIIFLILCLSYLVDKVVYFLVKSIEQDVFTGQTVGKFNQYLLLKDSVDVCIFGSSRANHHFDPDNFSNSAFNIGLDGRKIGFSWVAIKMLPNDKDQLVILHMDPETLFDKAYNGEDINSAIHKFHQNSFIKEEIELNENYNRLINFYWCLSYNHKVLGIVYNYYKPKYDFTTFNGYEPIVISENQQFKRKKVLERKINFDCAKVDSSTRKTNSVSLDYLNNIIKFCKISNKRLVVVTSPLYKDQCDADNAKMDEILKILGVEYYDFTNLFEENNKIEYWKDHTHLSEIGARIFSDSFSSKIKHYLNTDFN